jgi:predicted MFS family arabinose efflux permease
LWLANILGAGQVCSWGSLYYSFPLLAQAMGADLSWSKAEIFSGATISMLVTALFSFPVGVAIDRGKGKWLMAGASLMAALMLVWWSRVDNLLSFYVICAVLGALQACTLYEPAFAVMARRVGAAQARSRITTITLWGGFASTAFIPLEQFFLDHGGWRQSLLVLAFINLVWTGIYYFCIQPKHDVEHTAVAQDKEANKARDKAVVKQALKGSVFWLLLLALTLYSVMFTVFIFHAYPILQEEGLSTHDVVLALTVLGPAQVAGRIVIAYFASQAPMRLLGSIVACVFPFIFGALAAIDKPGFWLVAGLVACYGGANGIFTIVRSMVVPEMLSRHAYGALNGLLTIPTMIARAVGPFAAASIWMLQQSYQIVLIFVCITAILFALAFWAASWVSSRNASLSGAA